MTLARPLTPLRPSPSEFDPPTLNPAELRAAQGATLAAPAGRPHGVVVLLNVVIGVLYRRRPSLEKFLVLEHLAQIPYRSWERVAMQRIRRTQGRSALARRIQVRVAEARSQHDNEQWHMLVLEELIAQRRGQLSWFRFRLVPRLLAAPWHLTTWLLHLVKPAWSYALNAAFEEHAEHEYMRFVGDSPQYEAEPFDSELAIRWPYSVTVADVLRQIGHDERIHKLESIDGAARAAAGTRIDLSGSAERVARGATPGLRAPRARRIR